MKFKFLPKYMSYFAYAYKTEGKNGISCLISALSGFPPIREIREFRENFEDFFQSGKSGKMGGFQPKSGKKF